jgi:hypothetical protein
MVPTAGLNDQYTAVLDVPVTAAVYCCVCDAVRPALVGVSEMATGGCNVIVAIPDLPLESVARTDTVCLEANVTGAL